MLNKSFIAVFLFLFCVKSNCDNEIDETKVTIGNGVLQGEKRGHYYAFEGIPYAEPPTGENRYELPKPYTTTWTGIRNASITSDLCIQYDHFIFEGDKVHGSEDCLYLNVYTHNPRPEKKYPVLFYIHGGAFACGHGHLYGPGILMKKPMIVVTINYRLGPLGFLSTLDSEFSGNIGLKDQNFALKWVNENIKHFGGDSDKITIAGYSAGGASVHLHYMSKLSRGLFHSGISHSGSALNPWIISERVTEKAKELASLLDCPTSSTHEMKICLKTKPADEIVRCVGHFQPWLYMPFTIFGPVIEPESDTAFITKSPYQHIETGDIAPQPWIVSFTQDEGLYGASEIYRKEEYLPELNRRWLEIAPFLLDYNNTVAPDKLNEVSQKIREHFLEDLPINEDSYDKLLKLVSQRLFQLGIQKTIKLQSVKTESPIYFYYYRFPAEYGIEEVMSNSDKDLGVAHADDVLTIYETFIRAPPHGYNAEELVMQSQLLNLYESFLTTRQPKFGDTRLQAVHYDENGFNYLEIVNPTTYSHKTSKDLVDEEFWDSVVPYN